MKTDASFEPATDIRQTEPTRAMKQVAALTIGAAILRLLFLNRTVWGDEPFSVALAGGIAPGGGPAGTWLGFLQSVWRHNELNMVVYYTLLRASLHLGSSEAIIRLVSVLVGVATVPVAYVLGKRFFGTKVGTFCALMMAVHGGHVAFSQLARSYALVVLLCCGAYLAFLNAVEHGGSRYWAFWVLLVTLAIYSHFFTVLIVPAQLIALAWTEWDQVPWRRLILSLVAIVILALPAVFFILTRNTGQISWVSDTWKNVARLIGMITANRIALPAYLLLWAVSIRNWKRRRQWAQRSNQSFRYALVLAWAMVPLGIVLLVSIVKPVLEARYLLLMLPGGVLLAAQGLGEIDMQWRKVVAWATVVLSLAGTAYSFQPNRDQWKPLARQLCSEVRAGDVVTVVPAWAGAAMQYYWSRWAVPGVSYEHYEQARDAATWAQQTSARSGRVWVVVYSRKSTPYPETVDFEHAMAEHYRLVQRSDFRFAHIDVYSKTSE